MSLFPSPLHLATPKDRGSILSQDYQFFRNIPACEFLFLSSGYHTTGRRGKSPYPSIERPSEKERENVIMLGSNPLNEPSPLGIWMLFCSISSHHYIWRHQRTGVRFSAKTISFLEIFLLAGTCFSPQVTLLQQEGEATNKVPTQSKERPSEREGKCNSVNKQINPLMDLPPLGIRMPFCSIGSHHYNFVTKRLVER